MPTTRPGIVATCTLPLLAAAMPLSAAPAVAADTTCAQLQSGAQPPVDKGIPGPVQNLDVTAADASAAITWNPPAAPGTTITGYAVVLCPSDAQTPIGGQITQHTLTGLANATTYTVWVAARNSDGWGPATVSAPFTPVAAPRPDPQPTAAPPAPVQPPAPANVKAKKAKKPTVRLSAGRHRPGNKLTVRWRAHHVSHVRLTWWRGKGKPHTQRTSPTGRLTLAGPSNTRYRIRVQAGTAQAHRVYRIH